MSLLYLHLLQLYFIEINIFNAKKDMYLHLITIHIIIKLHLYTYICHCFYIYFFINFIQYSIVYIFILTANMM